MKFSIQFVNNYYITQYNYSVPGLKEINSGAVSYIFDKDNYDNKFFYLDLLGII